MSTENWQKTIISPESDVREAYINKLKDKLYGLLCEFEKGREWEKFLDSILIELNGFDIEEKTIDWYTLYHKISNLRYLRYEYFRSTIFECMNLFNRLLK
jgi:hypothetical protein